MFAVKASANSENGDAQLDVRFISNLLSLPKHQTRLLFNKDPENVESPHPTSSSDPSLTPREIEDHCNGNVTSPISANSASRARDDRVEGGESAEHDSFAMFALGTQHDSPNVETLLQSLQQPPAADEKASLSHSPVVSNVPLQDSHLTHATYATPTPVPTPMNEKGSSSLDKELLDESAEEELVKSPTDSNPSEQQSDMRRDGVHAWLVCATCFLNFAVGMRLFSRGLFIALVL